MRRLEDKIIPFEKVFDLSVRLRSQGKRIVSTNGCFDLLHWGHIRYLTQARELGDTLVVGVNSDESVRNLKGPSRPLNDQQTRCHQVAGLEAVDFVVLFGEPDPNALLARLRPAIHVKGGDYLASDLPERDVVERMGGVIRILPLVTGHSTTHLIHRLQCEI